jgi:putative RecB family exonuclease
MEQPTLDGMPRRLYPCTPTRLASWLDCPRRYRMTYLDRPPAPKGPPWAHNSLGASVHNALAGWWRLPLADRTVTAAGDLLDAGWIDQGYVSDAQSAQYRQGARHMVEGYTATLDPATEPPGVERTVGARTEQIVLSGRIDRLDERRAPGGGRMLAVVDYKTGRRPLTDDDARTSLALALYAMAAGRMFHTVCHLVELHHLPTSTTVAWEHSDEGIDRHVRRAESIAAECADADDRFRAGLPAPEVDEVFPPRPGPACGWCDYRTLCPEGAAASAPRRPWDGLAADAPTAGTPAGG